MKMFKRERIFSKWLTKQKRKWIYSPIKFKVKHTTYTPDFYLPAENLYIEVVGTRSAYYHNKKKIALFKKLYSNINFIILDYLGNPYPSKKFRLDYCISLALTENEKDKTEKLRKQKIKLIEIYRKGLEALAVKQRTIPV